MSIIKRIQKRFHVLYFKMKGVTMEQGAYIHRSVDIHNPKNVTIGKNSIFYKNISIYCSEKGGVVIGENSHIAPYGYLLVDKNKIQIGNHVAIGPFCTFICHSNNIEGSSDFFSKNYLDDDICIGDNVFIGAQCTILPGAVIESNVVVASNSVVKGRLESNGVYGGSPVKRIKDI